MRTLAVPVESAEDAAAKAQAILRAPLAPSAVDVLWPGWLAVLFEGARRGVDEQFETAQVSGRRSRGLRLGLGGGGRAPDAIAGAAAVPAGRAGRRRWRDWTRRSSACRPGVAYVPGEVDDPRDPGEVALAERVRAQFDPAGVLV